MDFSGNFISFICGHYGNPDEMRRKRDQGQLSVVIPIDKLSILVTVVFSLIVFREKLSVKTWIGLILLTCGTICIAVFT